MDRRSTVLTPTLHDIANDYIENMISNVKDMKAIILDKETQIIFSLEFSKSFALKQEIFMFENIEKLDETQKYNLSAIFFLRPTEMNVKYLAKILQNLTFKEIHLYFTNEISEDLLNSIAQYDTNLQIKTVQEVYLDYYIINSNLFHLNIESCIMNLGITKEDKWTKYDEFLFNRIVDGIISVCLSTRTFPVIKTIHGSKICRLLGSKVGEYFSKNSEFIRKECGREQNGCLFIFDRKEDPVTPLINQWTYQAMLHEVMTITNNIIDVKSGNNDKPEKFIVSDIESVDKFFSTNLHNDFGNVATEVEAAAEKLKKENSEMDKDTSIEEMKRIIERLPEKKKESMAITKHYKLFYEISEYVSERKLMELSPLEQDIACFDNRKDQFNKISAVLKDVKVSPLDKAKLYLLYVFRYENDNSIGNLKLMMEENGLKSWIEYGDLLLQYAGREKRTLDVLSNKDFISKSKNMIMSSFPFSRNQNAFMQHVSYLNSLVDRIFRGKVKDNEVETIFKISDKEKFGKIIVFNFGGITYEEAKDMATLGKQLEIPIITGGTYIHNSKSFLAELQMLKNNNDVTLQIK